jgi:hypothetical protein
MRDGIFVFTIGESEIGTAKSGITNAIVFLRPQHYKSSSASRSPSTKPNFLAHSNGNLSTTRGFPLS